MDIVKAIEKEKEYLSYRMKGAEPFHLIDAIKECGFDSLDAYFNAKTEYMIRQTAKTMTECAQSEIVSEAVRIIHNRLTGVWYAYSDKTCVFNGNSGADTYNAEYCAENGIPVYSLGAMGGTIVHSYGDLSWGIALPSSIAVGCDYFLNHIADIMQKHTDKMVTVSGNDILVDGKKVCGSTVYTVNGVFLFISYFSFSDKTDIIRAICNKETQKIPGYIDFMTSDDLERGVMEWLTE